MSNSCTRKTPLKNHRKILKSNLAIVILIQYMFSVKIFNIRNTWLIYTSRFYLNFRWKTSISCKCPKIQIFPHFWPNFVHSTECTDNGRHYLCVFVSSHSKDYVMLLNFRYLEPWKLEGLFFPFDNSRSSVKKVVETHRQN